MSIISIQEKHLIKVVKKTSTLKHSILILHCLQLEHFIICQSASYLISNLHINTCAVATFHHDIKYEILIGLHGVQKRRLFLDPHRFGWCNNLSQHLPVTLVTARMNEPTEASLTSSGRFETRHITQGWLTFYPCNFYRIGWLGISYKMTTGFKA